jgi:hypothetical protein
VKAKRAPNTVARSIALTVLAMALGGRVVYAQFASPTCVPPNCSPSVIQNIAIGGTTQSASINITGDAKVGSTLNLGGGTFVIPASGNYILANVASGGAGANLMNLQVAGATRFLVDLLGNLVAVGDADIRGGDIRNTTGALTMTSANNTNVNLVAPGTGNVVLGAGDGLVAGTTTYGNGTITSTSGGITMTAPINTNITLQTSGTGNVTIPGNTTISGNLSIPSGSLTGSGAALTNLNASQLTSGTVPSGAISGTYSNAVTFNNAANSFTGTYSGNGAALTNLNASNLATGTVPDGRLTGTYTGALTFSNAANSFTGNGAGLTALNGANVTGTVANATRATYLGASNNVTANTNGNMTIAAATTLGTENALYVNQTSGPGSLLLLQQAGVTQFQVSNTGTLTAGNVPWGRLSGYPSACGAGQYVSAVGGTLTCSTPTFTDADTLQTVTTRGNTTTTGITVNGTTFGVSSTVTGASSAGVSGTSPHYGVYGSTTGAGVSDYGVIGVQTGTGDAGTAGFGGAGGKGVKGTYASGAGIGIYGFAPTSTGYAGYFYGSAGGTTLYSGFGSVGLNVSGTTQAILASGDIQLNTGRLLTNSYSAATPSHSFWSDPDTGMYNRTTNQLGFSTGGAEQMYLTSGGLNVAGTARIGTVGSFPSATADRIMAENPAGDAYLQLISPAGGYMQGIGFSTPSARNGGQIMYNNSNGSYYLYGNGLLKQYIDDTGDTSIRGNLTVGNTSTAPPNMAIDARTFTGTIGYPIAADDATAGNYNGATYYNTATNKFRCNEGFVWKDCVVTGALTGAGTANYLSKYTSASTLGNSLVYDNGTNVGIGTTTPQDKLDVNGHLTLSGGAREIRFRNAGGAVEQFVWHSGTSIGMGPGSSSNSMFVTNAGNVGIGTSGPGTKLDVAGNIRASGTIYSTYPGGYSQTELQQWGVSSAGSMYIEPAGGSTLYLTDSWVRSGTLQIDFGRTNFASGNVGIWDSSPGTQMSFGNGLSHYKLSLYEASDNSYNYGMGVVSGQFSFHIGGTGARYAFYDSYALMNEIFTIDGGGDIVAPWNLWGNAYGWVLCGTGDCTCPNGYFVTGIWNRGDYVYCRKF